MSERMIGFSNKNALLHTNKQSPNYWRLQNGTPCVGVIMFVKVFMEPVTVPKPRKIANLKESY
jgi:hypothetical protein